MSKRSRFSLSVLFVLTLIFTLASCKNAVVTYTITYAGNGNSSGSAPRSQNKGQGQETTIASNTGEGNLRKEGMYVSGWNTRTDGTGTTYEAGETYSQDQDLLLYAIWDNSYLSFASDKSFTIKAPKAWEGTLQYSVDANTWTDWDGGTITSADNKLYLRGKGNTVITGDSYNPWTLTATGDSKISCTGNIENLLGYDALQSGNHPAMGSYCFHTMFSSCKSLSTAPRLPSTTLSEHCYCDMFSNCDALMTAPALPATTLATGCYMHMFDTCVSLTTAPTLPATTLARICYFGLFNNCIALTTVPALPATTLADKCYASMFFGCNKLNVIPDLPATTAKTECYNQMFEGCSALKLSETQTGDCQTPLTIHITETKGATDWNKEMCKDIGQTITGDPQANTTYYTSNTVISH